MALATKRKPHGTTHRKRSGQHHRHSKPYLKTYWPYLPMAVIVLLGVIVNNVWNHSQVLGAQSDFSSATLLDDTNNYRAQAQEPGLTLDPLLTTAAQAKADDMVKRDYWAHNTPDGQTPWSFITAAGYQYQAAGENLAYGFSNADDAVVGWMNSPEHRDNILNANYQNVGFGVATSLNYQGKGPETVVVAEYGEPVVAATHITFTVPTSNGVAGAQDVHANQELAAKPVSRIQLLTGGKAAWATLALTAIISAAGAVFVVRHGFRIRRALNRGEMFIVHHPWLDITIVFIITVGYILTRTSGLIR